MRLILSPESSCQPRAPDKVHIFISNYYVYSSPNPMFDHLLESSHGDDSNKWSNIVFGDNRLTETILTSSLTLDLAKKLGK